MSKEVNIMLNGLNFASHDTMIAVNPRPPTVFSVTVWSSPPTIRNADVSGSLFALADNRDLIAVLAVIQIDMNQHGEERDRDYYKQIFMPEPGKMTCRKDTERT